MTREAQEAGESATEGFKQRVFASAFGSADPRNALTRYYEMFEPAQKGYDEADVEEFEPSSEADVVEMFNAARRAGVIK